MDSLKAVKSSSGGSYGGRIGRGEGIVIVGVFSSNFSFRALTFVTKTSILPAVSDWLILNFRSQVTSMDSVK